MSRNRRHVLRFSLPRMFARGGTRTLEYSVADAQQASQIR